jgi:hypothetical protein
MLTAGGALAQTPQPPATAPTPVLSAVPPETATAQTFETVLPELRPFDMSEPRFWATAEYLLAWYTPMRTGPLIQTLPSAQVGLVSASSATTVFPNNNSVDFGAFSGLRTTVGANWDKFGVEVSGFVLQRKTESGDFFNNGSPVAVAQNYIAAGSGIPTSLYASLANQYSGGVSAVAQSRLWGGDANFRREWYAFLCDSAQLLVGFKYLNLNESLVLDAPSFFNTGGSVDIRDSIRTQNEFYGGYVGYHAQIGGNDRGLGFDFTTKSGVGGVAQRVDLYGSNSVVLPSGVTSVEPGGLYARGLNYGTFTRTRGAYMQDIDLKLTYNFNRYVQVYVGYSLQYLSSVVRPGREIDPVINDSDIRFIAQGTPTTLARPAFAWRAEELVVNGLTFGLKVQY